MAAVRNQRRTGREGRSEQSDIGSQKVAWTAEEDDALIAAIEDYRSQHPEEDLKWATIAANHSIRLNRQDGDFQRDQKTCSDRWEHSLNPDCDRKPITEEDMKAVDERMEDPQFGRSFAKVRRSLREAPYHRSSVFVKNNWHKSGKQRAKKAKQQQVEALNAAAKEEEVNGAEAGDPEVMPAESVGGSDAEGPGVVLEEFLPPDGVPRDMNGGEALQRFWGVTLEELPPMSLPPMPYVPPLRILQYLNGGEGPV